MEIRNTKSEKNKLTDNLNNFFGSSQSLNINGNSGFNGFNSTNGINGMNNSTYNLKSDGKTLPNPNEKYFPNKINSQREVNKERDNSNMSDIVNMINNAKIINNIPQNNHQKNNSLKVMVNPISPDKKPNLQVVSR